MLTKRQNLLETMKKGGKPDRFVNQYEYMKIMYETPWGLFLSPGQIGKDPWGVTFSYPENQPGAFPIHDDEHKVIKDITEWRKYVKIPEVDTSDAAWAAAIEHAKSVNRNDKFVAAVFCPGIFERTHHLMGMEDALMALYEEPEAMHDLIDAIVDYEIDFAKEVIRRIHPDALFHHDDWGSQISSFTSPEMFKEFYLPAYQKIYGYYKANGVELVVHHSDSYAANLVPFMIEMGIDIWQGALSTNNIPELIQNYGGQIAFHGGIDNGKVDTPDWSPIKIAQEVEKACRENGKFAYIPGLTMGGPDSSFPGVYDTVSKEIDRISKKFSKLP